MRVKISDKVRLYHVTTQIEILSLINYDFHSFVRNHWSFIYVFLSFDASKVQVMCIDGDDWVRTLLVQCSALYSPRERPVR